MRQLAKARPGHGREPPRRHEARRQRGRRHGRQGRTRVLRRSVGWREDRQRGAEGQAGRPLFYPKDETSGCTTEACAFRDAWDKLQKSGVVLVGISVDTDESHKAFAEHHKLPFHLVSDPKMELAKKFGVSSKFIDKLGITIEMRETIVIGKDGNVLKIYRNVDPAKHAEEIENDLGLGNERVNAQAHRRRRWNADARRRGPAFLEPIQRAHGNEPRRPRGVRQGRRLRERAPGHGSRGRLSSSSAVP